MFLFQSAYYTLSKYAVFSGRTSRSEFWCFFAFVIIAQAVSGLVGVLLGLGSVLAGLVGLLLTIPQIAVAVRRLHDLGRSGRELLIPGLMLLAGPIVYSFGGIVALGFAGLTLLVFANLLLLFLKEVKNIPNRYGGSPKSFSFSR